MNKIECKMTTLPNELQTFQSLMKNKGQKEWETNVAHSRRFHKSSSSRTKFAPSFPRSKKIQKKKGEKGEGLIFFLQIIEKKKKALHTAERLFFSAVLSLYGLHSHTFICNSHPLALYRPILVPLRLASLSGDEVFLSATFGRKRLFFWDC